MSPRFYCFYEWHPGGILWRGLLFGTVMCIITCNAELENGVSTVGILVEKYIENEQPKSQNKHQPK